MPHPSTYATGIDFMGSWHGLPAVMADIAARVRAAHARRKARREYEDLLSRDDGVFHDIGVSRDRVRRELETGR